MLNDLLNFPFFLLLSLLRPVICTVAPADVHHGKGPADECYNIGWWRPRRCWKNAFWFVMLLYPRCSTTALQMFAYNDLDIGRQVACSLRGRPAVVPPLPHVCRQHRRAQKADVSHSSSTSNIQIKLTSHL